MYLRITTIFFEVDEPVERLIYGSSSGVSYLACYTCDSSFQRRWLCSDRSLWNWPWEFRAFLQRVVTTFVESLPIRRAVTVIGLSVFALAKGSCRVFFWVLVRIDITTCERQHCLLNLPYHNEIFAQQKVVYIASIKCVVAPALMVPWLKLPERHAQAHKHKFAKGIQENLCIFVCIWARFKLQVRWAVLQKKRTALAIWMRTFSHLFQFLSGRSILMDLSNTSLVNLFFYREAVWGGRGRRFVSVEIVKCLPALPCSDKVPRRYWIEFQILCSRGGNSSCFF